MARYDDDDSEDGEAGNFFKSKKNFKKVKRASTGAVQSVNKLTKGTLGNASKMAKGMPGNVSKVAKGMPGNARKFATTSAGHVTKAGKGVIKGAGGAGSNIKRVGGKVVKKVKRGKSRSRGRSKSSGRSKSKSPSRPPVTKPKPGGVKGLWHKIRGRSSSSARDRRDDEENDRVSPLPSAVTDFPGIALGSVIDKVSGHAGVVPNGNGMGDSSGGHLDRSISQQEEFERRNESAFFAWLIHSSVFVKYCDIAFDIVDADGNGTVDDVELYAGLLLIHLKLGSILGPAACKPLSRPRCYAVFQKFDYDNSGGLDREEFRRVMMVLFSNVFARVLVQYTLTILVVPMIAKSVLHLLSWDSQKFWDYWSKPRGLGEELTLDDYIDWTVTSMPSRKRTIVSSLYYFFRIGSDSFWETFPLTFLTVVLGIVIAPFVLYYFDDMFQLAVDWNENRKAKMR